MSRELEITKLEVKPTEGEGSHFAEVEVRVKFVGDASNECGHGAFIKSQLDLATQEFCEYMAYEDEDNFKYPSIVRAVNHYRFLDIDKETNEYVFYEYTAYTAPIKAIIAELEAYKNGEELAYRHSCESVVISHLNTLSWYWD